MDIDEADSAAMAAAMGFSGFGMQNANKRRKYNPAADAVVDSSAIPMHNNQNKASGSGANLMPLGSRPPKQNTDEIDLDDDDDDPEPQYIDTSHPPATASDVDQAQSQIDSILGTAPIPPNQASYPPAPGTITGGVSSSGTPHEGHGRFSSNRGGGGRGRNNRDQPGQEWWQDYYDPSSNVNPWERLEQLHGLTPRGAWMTWDEAKA